MHRTHNSAEVSSILTGSTYASMVESVDTPDLKSVDHYGRGGSSPPTRMAQFSANSDQTTFLTCKTSTLTALPSPL